MGRMTMLKNKMKYLIGILCLTLFVGCAAYIIHMKNMKVNADKSVEVVTRGVIDEYEQLPKKKRNGKTNEDVGTEENPFLILEIVPCNEFAEIGYLIKGCEPVEVEDMYGSGDLNTIQSAKGAKVTSTICHFFPDEKEGNPDNYDRNENLRPYDWENSSWEGYYEKVEQNNGYFKQNSNGDIEVAGENNGDIIWHTVNDFEKDKYNGISFDDKISILKKKGDRIYTKRESKKEYDKDLIVQIAQPYYIYENYDYFLKDTLGLSQEEADKFSVVVKTITPEELNKTPEWVDCSNLIYLSPKSHFGNDLLKIWKNDKYRRSSASPSSDTSYYGDKQTFVGNDISWEVTEKIYKKVTAEVDWAGIVIDVTAHDIQKENKNIKLKIYNDKLQQVAEMAQSMPVSNNNVYKLCVMLYSMDSTIFKKLYFDEDDPKIKDGKDTLQTGYEAEYWCSWTFLLFDENNKNYTNNIYSYWTSDDAWEKYKTHLEFSQYRPWVKDHVYIFNGDNSLSQSYMNQGSANNNDEKKFTGYRDSVEEYKKEHGYGDDYRPTPSNAVRYILGMGPKLETGSIKVLDIEPSVGLRQKASSTDINQVEADYKLTEDDVRAMLTNNTLSKYKGNVEITHMTTAEFIGKVEDLNSTYDMIYMGLDDGAYNKDSNGRTEWNDSSLNGKIYFHTGDKITSSEQDVWIAGVHEKRSVKYLWSKLKDAPVDSLELRYPGNDITEIKKKELKDYIKSGRPIVMATGLYNNDESLIDQHSNISKFIKDCNGKGIYEENDSDGIVNAIDANNTISVKFTKKPREYNGDTENDTSSNIPSPNYLEKDSTSGESILPFEFTVDYKKSKSEEKSNENVKYACKLFVDQNQDSKFTDDEEVSLQIPATIKAGESVAFSKKLGKKYIGFINWKIVIYNVDNASIRFVETGCSAVAKSSEMEKKDIRVLQIMPCQEHIDKAKGVGLSDIGELNLKESEIFKKYYQNLADYSISIDTMTVEEYEKIFKDYYEKTKKAFSFDNSKDISFDTGKENPENYDISNENNLIRSKLKNYNMLILGFGDMYCLEDISNDYGAVDYIKYFIAQKKSVLFTHDTTSLNNVGQSVYGYTANTLLRDVMGMNRYAAVGNPDNTAMTKRDKNILINYQSGRKYDTVKDTNGSLLDAVHGYTYIALRRLGYYSDKTNPEKVPYKYTVTGVDGKPVYKENNNKDNKYSQSGFSNDNDRTSKVRKLNEGQITVYPYHIDKDEFSVAVTHSQYYQLNIEDPEVTVWYTLADDGKNYNSGYTTQSAHVYEVSPNDAANNYYIYSKGNVFYSSVGHSTVKNDMEAKLFVNTMIAAYRASYQSPYIEVQDAEVIDENQRVYQITVDEESGEKSNDTIRVYFKPTEDSITSSEFECSIYYPGDDGTEKGCEYITADKIFKKDDNECITKTGDTSGKYTLKRDQIYYFDYPRKYLKDLEHSKIKFKATSKHAVEPGYSTLNIFERQLFALD